MRRALILGGLLSVFCFGVGLRSVNAQTPANDYAEIIPLQVELAWLADPYLCCYHPSARLEGNKLRVSGYVPTKELQARALQIALDVSKTVVINEIVVHAGTRRKHADVPADVFLKSAARTLKARFPIGFRNWNLGLKGKGQLVVTGYASSYGQKLDVSEKLRILPGCVCVHNRLQVVGEPNTFASTASEPPLPKQVNTTENPQTIGKSSGPVTNKTIQLSPKIEPIPVVDRKPNYSNPVMPPAPRPSVYAKKHQTIPGLPSGSGKSPYGGSTENSGQVVSSIHQSMRSPYGTSQDILLPAQTTPSPYEPATPVLTKTSPSPYEKAAPVSTNSGPSPYEAKYPIIVDSGQSPYQSTGMSLVTNLQSPYQGTAQPVSNGPATPYKNADSKLPVQKSQQSPYAVKKPATGVPQRVDYPLPPSSPSTPLTTPIPPVDSAVEPSAYTISYLPTNKKVSRPNKTYPAPAKNTLREADLHQAIMNAVKTKNSQLQVHLDGNTLSIAVHAKTYQEADRLYEIITRMPELAAYRLKMAVEVPE